MKTRSKKYPARKSQIVSAIICCALCLGVAIVGLVFIFHPETRDIWNRGYIPTATFMALDHTDQTALYEQTYTNAVLVADLTKKLLQFAVTLLVLLGLAILTHILLLLRYRRDCPQDKQQ